MVCFRRFWLLLLMLFAAAPAAVAAPLEAYGKLPSIEDIAISPDGARLATIHTDGEKRTVVIEKISPHAVERVLAAGDAKLRGLMWVGPDHLVVLRSTTAAVIGLTGSRAEHLMGFDYNRVTGVARPLMSGVTNAMNTFFAPQVRYLGGKPFLYLETIYFPSTRGVVSVYRVDVERGLETQVAIDNEYVTDFVVDAAGEPIAETTWNERDRRWSLRLKAATGWREVRSGETLEESPELAGLGRDGRSVLVEELSDSHYLVRELSLDGVWSQPLPIADTGGGLIRDPVSGVLIGSTALVGDEQRYEFFAPLDQQVWALVQRAFPGQRLELASWSNDRHKIVVMADSPTEGPGYALVDLDAHTANWIANRYDRLGPQDLSPRKPLRFKAADGLELTGYLTLPNGKPAKNLPLIVFPHGGPAARDDPGFDWWAQAMASRGYAVLQVNFRGSDGFGWKFTEAGFGQWGRKMQTDLSDGVRYLAADGTIDPKRVCIVGASYGGYAAMAGPTLDPGVYRCAVAYAGISDMRAFVPWVEEQDGRRAERYTLRFIGAKSTRDATLSEISPATHVDRMNVPMLLIHGKDDTVVPLGQSRIMANDLRAAGKPVELLVLDSTDHWLTRGATRLQMLQATMAFVEKNNPPD